MLNGHWGAFSVIVKSSRASVPSDNLRLKLYSKLQQLYISILQCVTPRFWTVWRGWGIGWWARAAWWRATGSTTPGTSSGRCTRRGRSGTPAPSRPSAACSYCVAVNYRILAFKSASHWLHSDSVDARCTIVANVAYNWTISNKYL